MKKDLLKIGCKCVLILCTVILFWNILTPIFRKDKSSSAYQLRLLPENSIDILVLGSSHAQYSVNPGVIYNESGYYSYVLGSGCQPMVMSQYYLEEALKTQSPEVVILDVFTMLPAQAICYADGMFYVAASQMSGDTRVNAILNIDNEEKIMEYLYDLPISHDKWKEDSFTFEDQIDGMMGYVSQQPNDFRFHHLVPFERGNTEVHLKQKDLDALDRIIELCRENEIQLILMKAAFDIDQKNYDTLQAIWDIADEKDIPVIDFLEVAEEIGFTLGMDGDSWHNNTWGAQKVSAYLAQKIMENNYVEHHKENEVLEGILKNLKDLTARWLFTNNIDIYSLMIFAQKYDVSMIVKYTGTEGYSSIGDYENETLQKIGIDFDFHEQKQENYYAIIENGVTLMDGFEPLSTEVNGTFISIQDEKIQAGEKSFTNLGELEIIFCGNDFSWFHEMPIDYASRYFWRNECDNWSCSFQ